MPGRGPERADREERRDPDAPSAPTSPPISSRRRLMPIRALERLLECVHARASELASSLALLLERAPRHQPVRPEHEPGAEREQPDAEEGTFGLRLAAERVHDRQTTAGRAW